MSGDYKQVFGREPEAWRDPLGALRMTLWGSADALGTIERARNEVEWLCRVLNRVTDGSEGPVAMRAMGVAEVAE